MHSKKFVLRLGLLLVDLGLLVRVDCRLVLVGQRVLLSASCQANPVLPDRSRGGGFPRIFAATGSRLASPSDCRLSRRRSPLGMGS